MRSGPSGQRPTWASVLTSEEPSWQGPLGPSTYPSTKLRETGRTGETSDGFSKPQRPQHTTFGRYRTQEVASSSPASSIDEVPVSKPGMCPRGQPTACRHFAFGYQWVYKQLKRRFAQPGAAAKFLQSERCAPVARH
jgi:hypothetical protein